MSEVLYKGVKEEILDLNKEQDNELLEMIYKSPEKNMFRLETNEYLIIYDKDENKVIDKFRWDGNKYNKLKQQKIDNQFLGKVRGLNEYQDCIIDMILDTNITVKSSIGIPGGGKTFLATVFGLDMVLKGKYNKLVYIKNNVDIAHEKLGALPGSLDEKLDPWTKALTDILSDKYIVEKFRNEDKLEIAYLGHSLGRTFHNSFIIVDESQQLSRGHVYNLTTRLGHNSVINFCGDIFQTYSKKYEGHNSGIKFLHNQLKGQDFFACVHTKKSERSRTAQICANLLFDGVNE